jgi:hypothetical protein
MARTGFSRAALELGQEGPVDLLDVSASRTNLHNTPTT